MKTVYSQKRYQTLNAVHRGMYIADNLDFLKSLNDECIDLVCIDPPFAKNETFGRKSPNAPDPLKPPLTAEELRIERDLLARWGIHNPKDAEKAGIDWPETSYKDFWSWEADVHEDWLVQIEQNYRPVKELIEATQYVHGADMAAYLCYMAVRLFEIRRVLKKTGSLYLHCDPTAGAYLRQLLDGIFGNGENNGPGFRTEIIWCYRGMPSKAKKFQQKHDYILAYAKEDASLTTFNVLRTLPTEGSLKTYQTGMRVGYNANHSKKMVTVFDWKKYYSAVEQGKIPPDLSPVEFKGGSPPMRDWWDDIKILGGPRNKEKRDYTPNTPPSKSRACRGCA